MDLFLDALPALGSAFSQILQPTVIAYLFLGVVMGLCIGVFPGLGGIAGLSLLLPFMFGMDPLLGLTLMIGMVSIVPTSDTFASVLMGIPGSSASQANNAKEGGGLVPTLLFGIPGSGSMAIFIGALALLGNGIDIGPSMLENNLDFTYSIVWLLALANVLGTFVCICLASPISRLTTIRFALLAPFIFMVIAFAAFQSG